MSNTEAMISYKHKKGPGVARFVQYAKDPVPSWATDIQPHVEEPPATKAFKEFLEQLGLSSTIEETNSLLDIWKFQEKRMLKFCLWATWHKYDTIEQALSFWELNVEGKSEEVTESAN